MSFAKTLRMSKTTAVWISITALLVASLLPALLNGHRVGALQILDRSITMASSVQGAETTYDVSVRLPNGVTFGTIRLEFCNEDPLPGEACNTNTVESDNTPDLDDDVGTEITISNWAMSDTAGSATDNAVSCDTASAALTTTHTAGSDLTYLDIECGTGNAETVAAGGGSDTDYINFTINDVNNPTNTTSGVNNDPFYVRVYTFASPDSPTAYAIAAPPLGNYEGGIAMSTAEQITVEARVQERLDFVVGTDTVANDCATIAGTTVDLGVLDGATLNRATVDSSNAASPNVDGICTEVTTNAASGANISYLATDLEVSGATCSQANGDIDGTELNTDQCINWDNDAPAVYAGGNELWGLGILSTPSNGTTDVMTITAGADYDESGGWTDTVAIDPYAALAIELGDTAGSVADSESLMIDVAAEAAITTPTGLYQATLTFIATGSF